MELATGRKSPEELKDLLLQCIVTAYDPIYDAEVCAVKVYGAQDFAKGCVYADVMSVDEKGEAVVDFERIHDVIRQKVKNIPSDERQLGKSGHEQAGEDARSCLWRRSCELR